MPRRPRRYTLFSSLLWPYALLAYFDLVFSSVLSIGEAERTAEQLLGPYTADEHSKRKLVVRETRLNRAYLGSDAQLVERADPDAGKRKRVRGPEELESGGPISTVPLRAVGTGVAGEIAFGAPGPPPMKLLRVPAELKGAGGSASSSAGSQTVVRS